MKRFIKIAAVLAMAGALNACLWWGPHGGGHGGHGGQMGSGQMNGGQMQMGGGQMQGSPRGH